MSYINVVDGALHEAACMLVWTAVFVPVAVVVALREDTAATTPDQRAQIAADAADAAERCVRARAGRARPEP